MNENTAEIVRRKLDHSRLGYEMFNEGAKTKRHLPDWFEIYDGLASIFKSYVEAFEQVLELEGMKEYHPEPMKHPIEENLKIGNGRRNRTVKETHLEVLD